MSRMRNLWAGSLVAAVTGWAIAGLGLVAGADDGPVGSVPITAYEIRCYGHCPSQIELAAHRVKHWAYEVAREFVRQYHISRTWPWDNGDRSRLALHEKLAFQAANGRKQLATLWGYHFIESGHGLTPMGRRKLWRIVSQVESLGPIVYVEAADTKELTQKRVETVKKQLDELTRGEIQLAVVVSQSSRSFLSGDEAVKALKRMTKPRNESKESQEQQSQN